MIIWKISHEKGEGCRYKGKATQTIDKYIYYIYQYTCDREECNSSQKYSGYTESTVTERMRNHAQHGSIINHLRECYSISKIKMVELLKSVKILARGAAKQELLILEALYIKEEQPSLNGQEEGRDRVLQIF